MTKVGAAWRFRNVPGIVGAMPNHCTTCGRTFDTRLDLDVHVTLDHPEIRRRPRAEMRRLVACHTCTGLVDLAVSRTCGRCGAERTLGLDAAAAPDDPEQVAG